MHFRETYADESCRSCRRLIAKDCHVDYELYLARPHLLWVSQFSTSSKHHPSQAAHYAAFTFPSPSSKTRGYAATTPWHAMSASSRAAGMDAGGANGVVAPAPPTGPAQTTHPLSATRVNGTTLQVIPTSHTNARSVASPNGVPSAPPNRASPVPNQANLPNGKPSSPAVAASNTIPNGGAQTPQTVSSKDPKVAAQQASDMRNIVRRKLTGYVGFANLPNQWHRKSVRKGFNFNVMVVGEYIRPKADDAVR